MAPRTPVPVKKYVIRNSTKPSERWNEVVKDHEEHLADLARFLDSALITEFGWFFGGYVVPFFFWSLSCLLSMFSNTYIDELKGIAKISTKHGLTFSKLIAFNYGYDFLAYCTSAAVSEGNYGGANKVWHLRNMDWDGDILRKLTIDVEFKGSDSNSYTITTWVGMVGALTGMNSKRSVSLNFRKTHQSVLWAPWNFVVRTCHMIFDSPVGFSIRYYLNDSIDFIHLEPYVSSPCYITECEEDNGECFKVARNGRRGIGSVCLCGSDFTVVTNVDPEVKTVDKDWAAGDPLLLSAVDRRTKAEEELTGLRYPITPDKLFAIMQIDPIYNDQTIYTTIMCPDTGYYCTVVYQ